MNKRQVVMGLNLGYCSSASLVSEGEIIFAVQEERFSRRKNDESFPVSSIEKCLDFIRENDNLCLSSVAVGSHEHDIYHRLAHYYSQFSIKDRLMEQHLFWKPKLLDGNSNLRWEKVFEQRLDFNQYPGNWRDLVETMENIDDEKLRITKVQEFLARLVSDLTNVGVEDISFVEHHSCHAAYSYCTGPWDDCLVLTFDAYGDGLSSTVTRVEDGRFHRLVQTRAADFQLARLYRYTTLILGMKPDEHEFKVMGLAPYAKKQYAEEVYELLKPIICNEGMSFTMPDRPKDMYFYFKELFEGYRFDSIAGGLQLFTERLLVDWVKRCILETGVKKIAVAGGISLNIKALQAIVDGTQTSGLFAPPTAGDETLGIGAALHMGIDKYGWRRRAISNAYWGPSNALLTKKFLATHLDRKLFSIIEKNSEFEETMAEFLANGLIIGRCVERMEFGARSLGNRAILAHPSFPNIKEKINEKIKSRDFWMPFAPSILEERAKELLFFDSGSDYRFMTLSCAVREEWRSRLIAAIHPADGTARPQMVSKMSNPKYHSLISRFSSITGIPALLNTSFNLHGEPIVMTAEDAIRVFKLSGLDVLELDDYLIVRK